MTVTRTMQPLPFYALSGEKPEPPKALSLILDFAADTVWTGDLLSQLQTKRFQSLRSIYYNLADCANDVVVTFPQTGQRLNLQAGHQGYTPVIASDQMQFEITGTAPDVFRIHLLNVDIEPIDWGPPVGITPASITMNSPRLLGRYSAGVGSAEEIALSSDFSIAAGTLALTGDASGPLVAKAGGSPGGQMSGYLEINLSGSPLPAVPSPPSGSLVFRSGGPNGGNAVHSFEGFGGAPVFVSRRANGTTGAPTGLLNGQSIFLFGGQGYGATSYGVGNRVSFNLTAGENWTDAAQGTFVAFFTTPDGTTSITETARLGATTGFSMYGANIVISANRGLKRRPFTFATLPAAALSQDEEFIMTDGAAAPVWLAAAAGGGAVRTPVISNGTAWQNG